MHAVNVCDLFFSQAVYTRLTQQVGSPAHTSLAKYLGEGTQAQLIQEMRTSPHIDNGCQDRVSCQLGNRVSKQRGQQLISAIWKITQHIAKMK